MQKCRDIFTQPCPYINGRLTKAKVKWISVSERVHLHDITATIYVSDDQLEAV